MNRRSITPTAPLYPPESINMDDTDSIASIEIKHIIKKTNYNYTLILFFIILIIFPIIIVLMLNNY